MPARARADAGRVRLRALEGDWDPAPGQGVVTLARACGHVAGDPSITRRAYRYYRGIGLDLGGRLTLRFTLEDGRTASVTMVAGIDIESGAGVLDGCASTEEAARELAVGPGTVWALVLTLENATISWRQLNRTLPIADPSAFGAFAAELGELPLLDLQTCPLCAEHGYLAA
jgi:hypothetical protein